VKSLERSESERLAVTEAAARAGGVRRWRRYPVVLLVAGGKGPQEAVRI
jgi:hypothetical protein